MKMLLAPMFGLIGLTAGAQDGAALFKQHCTMCHKLGARLVGPDLIGVTEKQSQEWLMAFIKSSNSMIKSGDPDAVAIFKEFHETPMPDQPLSDVEIKSILTYIESQGAGKAETADQPPAEPEEPIVYTEADIAAGLMLFDGKTAFKSKGPSCVSCHNVTNDGVIPGGRLAKDLTNVYTRMGDAGIAGILSAPPFPAMSAAYINHPLDSAEVSQLLAFLQHVDETADTQTVRSGATIFLFGGGGGLIVVLLLIALLWRHRLRKAVKYDIFKRQIKSI